MILVYNFLNDHIPILLDCPESEPPTNRDSHSVSLYGIQKTKGLFSLYSGKQGQASDPCSTNYMFFPGMLNRNKK